VLLIPSRVIEVRGTPNSALKSHHKASETAGSHIIRKSPKSVSKAQIIAKNSVLQPNVNEIKAFIAQEAVKQGVNPHIPLWIAEHESSFQVSAIGDDGESRGIFQISRRYHPEVSDACAYDYKCATEWSLARIAAGHANEWTTWKNKR
jgi:hypothetical protein